MSVFALQRAGYNIKIGRKGVKGRSSYPGDSPVKKAAREFDLEQVIKAFGPGFKNKKFLVLASRENLDALTLVSLGVPPRNITCVEMYHDDIVDAVKTLPEANYFYGNIEHLTIDDVFDVIYLDLCGGSCDKTDEILTFLQDCYLNDDGLLFVSTQTGRPPRGSFHNEIRKNYLQDYDKAWCDDDIRLQHMHSIGFGYNVLLNFEHTSRCWKNWGIISPHFDYPLFRMQSLDCHFHPLLARYYKREGGLSYVGMLWKKSVVFWEGQPDLFYKLAILNYDGIEKEVIYNEALGRKPVSLPKKFTKTSRNSYFQSDTGRLIPLY